MKLFKNFLIFLFSCLFLLACNKQIEVDDIVNQAIFKAEDEKYKDVYQALDGNWNGIFYIYQDTVSRPVDPKILSFPTKQLLSKLPLKLQDTIVVNQVYESPTPYFQTVTITDYYPAKDEFVTSKGVNKVQDGQMWCVVHKPNETIIHKGSLESSETIIWQRNIPSPLSKEFFRETIRDKSYEIVGWGYYGESDTTKMPPYWFYGLYKQ